MFGGEPSWLSSPTPSSAIAAAIQITARELRPSSPANAGTKITCSVVMNALRPTVVYCSPVVCVA